MTHKIFRKSLDFSSKCDKIKIQQHNSTIGTETSSISPCHGLTQATISDVVQVRAQIVFWNKSSYLGSFCFELKLKCNFHFGLLPFGPSRLEQPFNGPPHSCKSRVDRFVVMSPIKPTKLTCSTFSIVLWKNQPFFHTCYFSQLLSCKKCENQGLRS